jgi:hypothetical protein
MGLWRASSVRSWSINTGVQAVNDVCDLEAIRRTLTGSLHAWLPCLVDRALDHAHRPGESADQIVLTRSALAKAALDDRGEPSDTEAIFVHFDAGEETAISLDREVFEGGIAHEDGAITLQLGGVEFVIARRE